MSVSINRVATQSLSKSNINLIRLTALVSRYFPDYGETMPKVLTSDEAIINIVADVYNITNALVKCWETENATANASPPNYMKYVSDIGIMVWEAAYGNAQMSKEEQNSFTFGNTKEQHARFELFLYRMLSLLHAWSTSLRDKYPVYEVWKEINTAIAADCFKGEQS